MVSTVIAEKIILQVCFELIYVRKELIHTQDTQKYAEENILYLCVLFWASEYLSNLIPMPGLKSR